VKLVQLAESKQRRRQQLDGTPVDPPRWTDRCVQRMIIGRTDCRHQSKLEKTEC